MFIPRVYEDNDICPPNAPASCVSDNSPKGVTLAIIGTDPTDQTSGQLPAVQYHESPLHRFIGVGMVVAMIFVTVGLWMYFARWPRRMMYEHCCCSRRRKQGQGAEEPKQDVSVSQLSEDLTVQGGLSVIAKPDSAKTGKWKGRGEAGLELGSMCRNHVEVIPQRNYREDRRHLSPPLEPQRT